MQAVSVESTILLEVSYFKLHGQNQKLLYPKFNGYRYNGEKNSKKAVAHLLIIK
jgi:hypothetical protein